MCGGRVVLFAGVCLCGRACVYVYVRACASTLEGRLGELFEGRKVLRRRLGVRENL